MYPNISRSPYLDSTRHLSKHSDPEGTGVLVRNFDCNRSASYKYEFRSTSKQMKKLPLSLPLKRSKYKWENVNNRAKTEKSFLNDIPSFWNEKVPSHHRVLAPFINTISKGWFSQKSCDVSCTKSSSFDLRSCCFIDDKYLPTNTIRANMLPRKITGVAQKKSRSPNFENENSLVKLSKHKLIRNQNRVGITKVVARRNDSSLVLRTRRKLIRKMETSSKELSKTLPDSPLPLVLESKLRERDHFSLLTPVLKEEASSKKPIPASLVVLTRRKLIREPHSAVADVAVELPNKLISVNRNKLIRSSCLLRNNSRLSKSVLYHMIRQRRRPYSRSSYVLLTRNKLIRRAKFKQKQWRKQSVDGSKVVKRSPSSSKMLVAVGKNKLIRKSLFSKRNKITSVLKTTERSIPFRKAILARVLNSPSKRLQRFTNHLSRMNLKYTFIRGRSRYANKSKRYLNKCKNNRKTFRRRNNRICPLYRRTGNCLKHTEKNCPFLHDSKYIALCQKYLKDSCEKETCPLSHEVIFQKMPLCVHFLNDDCSSDGCPFSHMKPDIKAPICVQFLRGYCELADKCPNWHVYACPEYKNSSTCAKDTNCRLPHRSIEFFENNLVDRETADAERWRYFEKNALNDDNGQTESLIPNRDTMGNLPEFIPL